MSLEKRSLGSIQVQFVKGVGEKRGQVLAEHGVKTVEELIYLFPRRYLDRTSVTPIRDLHEGEETTIVGKIISNEIVPGRRERCVALVGDGTGVLQCVWFQRARYWRKFFQPGESVSFSGKVTHFRGYQMTHPEFDKLGLTGDWQSLNTGAIVPLYPSSEALTKFGFHSKGFRKIIHEALQKYSELIRESLPEKLVRENDVIPLKEALNDIHFPENLETLAAAQTRLKFDELFYLELILALRKKNVKFHEQGISFKETGDKTRRLIENLGFELTDAQKRVLREIWTDMKSSAPMNRLVQGDVGSGKTIVALTAMLMAVENGYQAAMMAPTEILAEQHYLSIHKMLEDIDVPVTLLTGSLRKKQREKVYGEIANGNARVAVGTHALIQPEVKFQNLGMAIVDEQHRFGVMQRAALRQKGGQPDVLVMTATPIPRTLSMTLYGDLDVSIIDELPAGRKPIRSVWRASHKRKDVYSYVRDELRFGAQAYIVFPLVEESEKVDLRAAQETYDRVKTGFFDEFEVGLLHGRMKADEKEEVMRRFKSNELQLLISTTVIEVGVDVPNATIMVIEHAERFGLTQLHQLRGRVGRGEKESICIFIVDTPMGPEARRRIETMCETNDGFRIAEVDLEIRGPGEFFGTKQHGLPDLKIANLVSDQEILEKARDAAFSVVESNTMLKIVISCAQRYKFFQKYQEKMELAKVG